ncbi:efflux RND transporter periplasmic adaptor subunit [Geobacter sp. SVR]|uniref:efflux RND transporter periplasmic adaptor subunit n=1 Tax=Geobacter sp. SVR TaxID=2495594 RepID=UPI00143F0516|nr:efflux RND transporter periplasmic adaptor subunit [Geobacter sp. SVR]BCS55290.1 hemolysin secretion protein D [Geobacter sp. SVR]GCF86089.1 hemolysin secretion protein D [Geobacter sp. SVR]
MNKKILITLLILLIAGAAVFFTRRIGREEPHGLKVSGAIEATTVELSFKVPGRLTQRLVDEGDVVRAGQLVARLEADELQEERNTRSAELRAAEAGLADLEAGSRQEEIAQGAAALARFKAEAERLARDADRAEGLYRREVIPLKELEAARAGRDSSAAAVREAEQHLKLLQAGARPDAVRQARARVAASTAALTLSETRLAQSMLFSPLAGQVLVKQAEPGEQLAPGSAVVTVGKLDQPWLRAYIPEDQLGRVKVGQKARVTVDSWPGRFFEGRVSFISAQAEFTPKNVQTEKERVKLVYRIKIILANPAMELKPGMPADAVIETGDEGKNHEGARHQKAVQQGYAG